ncbi:hypothetical protein SHIRM173S_10326 [Streptomyces hirsutus]
MDQGGGGVVEQVGVVDQQGPYSGQEPDRAVQGDRFGQQRGEGGERHPVGLRDSGDPGAVGAADGLGDEPGLAPARRSGHHEASRAPADDRRTRRSSSSLPVKCQGSSSVVASRSCEVVTSTGAGVLTPIQGELSRPRLRRRGPSVGHPLPHDPSLLLADAAAGPSFAPGRLAAERSGRADRRAADVGQRHRAALLLLPRRHRRVGHSRAGTGRTRWVPAGGTTAQQDVVREGRFAELEGLGSDSPSPRSTTSRRRSCASASSPAAAPGRSWARRRSWRVCTSDARGPHPPTPRPVTRRYGPLRKGSSSIGGFPYRRQTANPKGPRDSSRRRTITAGRFPGVGRQRPHQRRRQSLSAPAASPPLKCAVTQWRSWECVKTWTVC